MSTNIEGPAQEGDLIEVTNGESVIRSRVVAGPSGLYINPFSDTGGTSWVHIGWFRHDGRTLKILDRPKPAVVLPTGLGSVIDSQGDYFALDVDGNWTNLWSSKIHDPDALSEILASRGDGSFKVISRPVADVAAEVLADVVRESGLINTSSPQWLKVAAKWGVTK